MAIEIGAKGLSEVNLTIPQGTSLTFTVAHKDEEGEAVDHSGSTARMAFQTKDKSTTIDLSEYCACGAEGVTVNIPPSVTSALSVGKMMWDMIVTTDQGEALRMAYGGVAIVDTYALDEAQ